MLIGSSDEHLAGRLVYQELKSKTDHWLSPVINQFSAAALTSALIVAV